MPPEILFIDDMKRIAILIDWENIRKQVFEVARKPSSLNKFVNYNDVDNVLNFAKAFIGSDEEIYRIFIYLSRPLEKTIWKGREVDFSHEPAYQFGVRFIENISPKDLVAVRKGKLQYRGPRQNGNPDFVQKQVDMLMGLDISHLSFYHLVDRMLILSYDTDFVPALKIARTHGIQICVGYCPDIQALSAEVKTHSDYIREKSFLSIFP